MAPTPTRHRKKMRTGPARLAIFTGLFVLLSTTAPLVIYRQLELNQLRAATSVVSTPIALLCALVLVIYFTTDGLRLHHILRALGHSLPASNIIKLECRFASNTDQIPGQN